MTPMDVCTVLLQKIHHSCWNTSKLPNFSSWPSAILWLLIRLWKRSPTQVVASCLSEWKDSILCGFILEGYRDKVFCDWCAGKMNFKSTQIFDKPKFRSPEVCWCFPQLAYNLLNNTSSLSKRSTQLESPTKTSLKSSRRQSEVDYFIFILA